MIYSLLQAEVWWSFALTEEKDHSSSPCMPLSIGCPELRAILSGHGEVPGAVLFQDLVVKKCFSSDEKKALDAILKLRVRERDPLTNVKGPDMLRSIANNGKFNTHLAPAIPDDVLRKLLLDPLEPTDALEAVT